MDLDWNTPGQIEFILSAIIVKRTIEEWARNLVSGISHGERRKDFRRVK